MKGERGIATLLSAWGQQWVGVGDSSNLKNLWPLSERQEGALLSEPCGGRNQSQEGGRGPNWPIGRWKMEMLD